MSWFILFIAGIFEVVWAVGLKHIGNAAGVWLWVGTLVAVVASMGLLSLAMKQIPLGTAYAVWTGIGAVGTFVAGIVWFGESASLPRILSAALVVAGLIGLKLTTAE